MENESYFLPILLPVPIPSLPGDWSAFESETLPFLLPLRAAGCSSEWITPHLVCVPRLLRSLRRLPTLFACSTPVEFDRAESERVDSLLAPSEVLFAFPQSRFDVELQRDGDTAIKSPRHTNRDEYDQRAIACLGRLDDCELDCHGRSVARVLGWFLFLCRRR